MTKIVDLGCGDNHDNEANIFVDIRHLPGLSVQADLVHLPFLDNILDGIITKHTIEHLHKDEAILFLKQCLTALTDEGWIKISTPDVRAMSLSYLDYLDNENYQEIDNLTKNYLGGMTYDENYHRWLYCIPTITQLLEEVGFQQIDVVKPSDRHELCVIAWKTKTEEVVGSEEFPWLLPYREHHNPFHVGA